MISLSSINVPKSVSLEPMVSPSSYGFKVLKCLSILLAINLITQISDGHPEAPAPITEMSMTTQTTVIPDLVSPNGAAATSQHPTITEVADVLPPGLVNYGSDDDSCMPWWRPRAGGVKDCV